jgi:hypothetical protein
VARSGKFAFFALTVELKEGINLAARDKTGNQTQIILSSDFLRIINKNNTAGRPLKCANLKYTACFPNVCIFSHVLRAKTVEITAQIYFYSRILSSLENSLFINIASNAA